MPQLAIDFTARIENNIQSQSILNQNKDKLNNQCQIVLDLLMKGERLTVRDAMIHYGIGDLRRRVKDLKDAAGISINSNTLPGGFKEYFIKTVS